MKILFIVMFLSGCSTLSLPNKFDSTGVVNDVVFETNIIETVIELVIANNTHSKVSPTKLKTSINKVILKEYTHVKSIITKEDILSKVDLIAIVPNITKYEKTIKNDPITTSIIGLKQLSFNDMPVINVHQVKSDTTAFSFLNLLFVISILVFIIYFICIKSLNGKLIYDKN